MTKHKTKKSNNDGYKVAIIGALVALLLMMGHVSKSQQFSQAENDAKDPRKSLLNYKIESIKTEKS